MFSTKNFLLCLVALFTSIVSSLPVTPSSFPTENTTLVSSPTDYNSLVSGQGPNDGTTKSKREWCLSNKGYCEDLCDFYLDFCDDIFCANDPAYCRKILGPLRCPQWGGGPWWCHPEATPPPLDEEMNNVVERSPQDDPEKQDPEEHEEPNPVDRSWCKKHPNHPYCYSQFCRDHPGSCKVAVDSAAFPPPPPPSAEVTATATVTKKFMVPEQTPGSSVVKSATPSPTSTGGDDDDSMNKENTQSLVKRGGWYCLWLCD